MNNPVIQKTKDYSKFKLLKFSNDKTNNTLNRLRKSIKKENLLHLHPIIVNDRMEVISGQHRLEIAKELQLDVYYIIDNSVSYQHVLEDNEAQHTAQLIDAVKFHALKDGKLPYVKFYEYTKLLEINPKSLIGLIFGNVTFQLIDFIKSGKFQLPTNIEAMENIVNKYIDFMDFVQAKKIRPYSMFKNHNFTTAFRNLVTLSLFDETKWRMKLEQKWFEFKPQLNSKEWFKLLLSIYNWKNQNPIDL